ncbi:hypothetical protein GCM10020254_87430 [Streptomyces goshikiensis]
MAHLLKPDFGRGRRPYLLPPGGQGNQRQQLDIDRARFRGDGYLALAGHRQEMLTSHLDKPDRVEPRHLHDELLDRRSEGRVSLQTQGRRQ